MLRKPRGGARRSGASLVACICVFGATGSAGASEVSFDARVRYAILDEDGAALRTLDDADRQGLLNRARCECGAPIQAEVSTVGGAGDPTRTIFGFVGNRCDSREAAEGRNGLCSILLEEPVAKFRTGFTALFHPAFLGSYVESAQRRADSPYTTLARGCEGEGEGGVWLCDPAANGVTGCQAEDFVYDPETAESGVLRYDFEPPHQLPHGLRAEPRADGVLLRWELPDARDIAGFRVLCETDWQYSAELEFPAPARDAVADGTGWYTVASVCGGEPQALVKVDRDMPAFCGDGRVDAGEECDEGTQNSDAGLCSDTCQLCVSREMQRLDWSRVCSGFIAPDQTSVLVTGLDPGSGHVFALVAHDAAGNARALGQLATVDPYEPAELDDTEGFMGFCAVSPEGHGAWGMSLGLCAVLTLLRRRRRG
ncbi:hypothetical protein [Nannocystis bainbridge]|uniref:DUF2330 domain-containing protein n=1 Tax=Nannocystis bainbridge TaxID=2995303 RepID=A0ABT5E5U3_9BACT|nr:hypothetical protein [Nannocystis bainbridge]MDC0721222.1 hypothetical protein [Nannocystis bainbridge]